MYFNILRKDLKRKKTMNVVILLFITLAVMFVSSSVNMLMSVTNALDAYFDKAGLTDYFIVTSPNQMNGKTTEEALSEMKNVEKYYSEDCMGVGILESSLIHGDDKIELGNGVVTPFEQSHIKFFDSKNKEITGVPDGEIYLLNSFMDKNKLKAGDEITLNIGDSSMEFTIKGEVKDALFGSSMTNNPRFLINQKSYNEFFGKNESWKFICIETKDTEALEKEMSSITTMFNASKSMVKISYVVDMLIAAVLLVVSVCLILIALLILRFTIGFTLSEEFREIGIMKAIGIRNGKIRGLYLTKYFAMSIVGAVIGVLCGIPFGNMFIYQASRNIMMTPNGGFIINILCGAFVIGVIMLFCYICTGRIKKVTPIDAVRFGDTGERYKKKGIMRLNKSSMSPVPFMAVNDILSGVGRFVVMTITFVIGIMLIIIITNTLNTLKSDKLIPLFSMAESDVYIEDKTAGKYLTEDGDKQIKDKLSDIKSELAENGIKADCFCEVGFNFTIKNGEYSCKSYSYQGVNTVTDMYEYLDGTAPQNTNEVAITHIIADKIHAEIGDTVTITTTEGDRKYIVTAIFQSMNSMGEGIRFHQGEKLNYAQVMSFFAYQIKYIDNPSEREITDRMELIKKLYPAYTVQNGSEFTDRNVGGIAEYMGSLKTLIIGVVLFICILVAVLMEKSYLAKEKEEIAMLKAVGFKNKSIVSWQTLRIAIVMIISALIAIALSLPMEQISIAPVFRMMGASSIAFEINVPEAYIAYPFIVLSATILSVWITAQQVRRVSPSEINSIE